MSDAAKVQSPSLAELVEHDRAKRVHDIERTAAKESRRIVAEARKSARKRAQQAVQDAREQIEGKLKRLSAELATERRKEANRAELATLKWAWSHMNRALEERWQHAPQQRAWIERLVEASQRMLPPGRRRVELPVGAMRTFPGDLFDRLDFGDEPPELVELPEIQCGLRIRVGNALLDGSEHGLLADRRWVEGRVLAEYAAREPGDGEAL